MRGWSGPVRRRRLVVAGAIVVVAANPPAAARVGVHAARRGGPAVHADRAAGHGGHRGRARAQSMDAAIAAIPVERVFGKIGRATATDRPCPRPRPRCPRPRSAARVFPADLIAELDAAVQVPGMPNLWWMPIQTRTEMLTTGVRSPIGITLRGDTTAQLEAAAVAVEAAVQSIPGTQSAFAERATGGFYLDIDVRRAEAARHGLSVAGSTRWSRPPSAGRRRPPPPRAASPSTSPSATPATGRPRGPGAGAGAHRGRRCCCPRPSPLLHRPAHAPQRGRPPGDHGLRRPRRGGDLDRWPRPASGSRPGPGRRGAQPVGADRGH